MSALIVLETTKPNEKVYLSFSLTCTKCLVEKKSWGIGYIRQCKAEDGVPRFSSVKGEVRWDELTYTTKHFPLALMLCYLMHARNSPGMKRDGFTDMEGAVS
jgi:hypothetical protein